MTRRQSGRAVRLTAPLLLGLVYFVVTALTLRFTRYDGGVAFFWAGTAMLLAVLITAERRRWAVYCAACSIGGAAATWLFGLGPIAALPLAAINTAEALLIAWGMRRWCVGCGTFQSVGEIGGFLLIAGLAGPAAGATLGASVVHLIGHVPYWPNWFAWFTSRALGAIIVAPLLLLAIRGDLEDWARDSTRAQQVEALLLLTILAGVSALSFSQVGLPLLFVPFLPMMVTVFRLGRIGATSSAVILAIVAGYFTVRGLGPIALVPGGAGTQAQFLQLYLATAVLMALPAAGDLRRRQTTLIGLQEQNALHKLILDRTGDVIMTIEPAGQIRYASPSVERIMGRTPASLMGTMSHGFIHPDDIDLVVASHRQALVQPEQTFAVEYRVVVDGKPLGWFESHSRATIDAEGRSTGVVNIIRDTSERKAHEVTLEHGAHTDTLTGIGNRRAFDRAMAMRAISGNEARAGALAMFDLDHFKGINDRFGQAGGDEALRVFAALLRRTLRDRDLVARVGGEEFVAVLEGADLQQAHSVCERIRRGMAETRVSSGKGEFQVTVSAGIAALTPGVPVEQVVAAADAALYRAKEGGRNRLSLAA